VIVISPGMSSSPAYLEEPDWVAPLLDDVSVGLASSRRDEALMLLDGVLHLEQASRFPSVHRLLVDRLTAAIAEIEGATVERGARLWRLYNHGFVVRTASVTLGLDVVPGWNWWDPPSRFGISSELAGRLVEQCDLLTVSHGHPDHADPLIRDLAFEHGVPLLVEESVFPEVGRHPLLHRARYHEPALIGRRRGVGVIVYPGHQGPDVPNCLYHLRTADGVAVLHTGDESGDLDWEWLDRLGTRQSVDVLLANCWTDDLPRLVTGVRPRLTVLGHENEMSHEPLHREAYWRSIQLARRFVSRPTRVLAWGESLTYGA
jgi:hypothetical protein